MCQRYYASRDMLLTCCPRPRRRRPASAHCLAAALRCSQAPCDPPPACVPLTQICSSAIAPSCFSATTCACARRGTPLADFFTLLSTTADGAGKRYVSTAQARRYPFVAAQWHPEKTSFEWGAAKIPHSGAAVRLAQALSLAFVQVRPGA